MTEKERIYADLEKTAPTYRQLLSVSEFDAVFDAEPFVVVPADGYSVRADTTITSLPKSGEDIIVRKTVYEKLAAVDLDLKKTYPNYQLVLSYGWRDLDIQESVFNENCDRLRGWYPTEEDLREAVNMFIAAPETAGHPTGGAADVSIFDIKSGKYLDFGTEIGDFENRDIIALSPFVSAGAQAHRRLLRAVMSARDFSPFDGEWWHFSYGDREWAFNKGRRKYLFSQKRKSDLNTALFKRQGR